MLFHVVALVLIACIPVLCWRCSRPPSLRSVAVALLCLLPVVFLSLAFGVHNCDRGAPITQWAIPSAVMAFVLACVAPKWLRRTLAPMLAFAAVALSLDFAGRVHRPDVVGDPDARCTIAHPLWHTPLTGFYRAEEEERPCR